jgi:hypothetical protein
MQPILLNSEKFEDIFGYSYEDLNIKLEKTRDGESRETYIHINSLEELKLITKKINKKSFLNGRTALKINI